MKLKTNKRNRSEYSGRNINTILFTLYHELNTFSKESYEYLQNKNYEYHKWIESEIATFKQE